MLRPTDIPPLPTQATIAIDLMESAGFEVWCVGGFVRDSLLGRPVHDIDFATNALWEQTKAIFENAGYQTFETGIKHGTITAIVDSMHFEITTYRNEGTYEDQRHPSSVTFVDTIEEDLARRDFTINALAFHPKRGICDPYNGVQDIEDRIIRTVGIPDERFGEDALRILRGARFTSQLGFSLETHTFESMQRNASALTLVSTERCFSELDGLICGDFVHDAIITCIDIIGAVIPEVLPMKEFDQKNPYHIYDVLEHTAHTMQETPNTSLIRWSALFHDVGKPHAFFADDAGVGHFYGHAKYSKELSVRILRRLRAPSKLIHDVALLVTFHDVVAEPQPKSVKRMIMKLDGRVDLFYALCELKKGDTKAQAPHVAYRLETIDELMSIADKIVEEQQAFSLKDLAINGNDLIEAGYGPGPRIGELLNTALVSVIDEVVPNTKGDLLIYLKSGS